MSDVLIIGGGVIGLAIAVELRLRGAEVALLTRSPQEAAARAAAGMLAPRAEALPSGPLRDLCHHSLSLYPDWIAKLEHLSGMDTGYWPCGILAPQYTPPERPTDLEQAGHWLDGDAIRHLQPGLGADICGGWWFAEDGQVDNRMLLAALLKAAQELGVTLHQGVTVAGLQQQGDRIMGVRGHIDAADGAQGNSPGDPISSADVARLASRADHYIVTAGAWVRQLLPLPVQPCKGEMLAVRQPPGAAALQQVLYGPGTYIVPRRDGRIIIGATMEPGQFAPGNTVSGVHHLLGSAIRLYPALETYPVEEMWWGFRPQTPDELPILGAGHCANLTLAVGHHRNGILLAPATAALIADQICPQPGRPHRPVDLAPFSWRRFWPQSRSAPFPSPSSGLPSTPATSASTTMTPQLASPTASANPVTDQPSDDALVIAGRTFHSRLMTGTGKYRSFDQMRQAIAASDCEIVTVAVRRVQTAAPGHEGLAEALDWKKLWMLPNTAGCKTAEDAIRVARLGREMAKLLGQEDNNFVKLEVIPDPKYLLPDPIGTLQAAEQLVKEGFAVLPYINADPLLARRLEEAGCATVMPLGSPIGSGQGIRNAANIAIIVESAGVPVVVDAGIGTPSEAALAMELGADALLVNTAIAQAADPATMARAMALATTAGRLGASSGRIPVKAYASASSPQTGTITQ